MKSQDGIAKAQDAQARTRSGTLVAIFIFIAAYAVFILRYQHLGLALGWMPSAMIGWAFGWIAYKFPWIADVVAILLELIVMVVG